MTPGHLPNSVGHSPGVHGTDRLRRGVLGPLDIAASTMANIAPAMSFFFGFATIAAASGVASPLTIVVGAIAIALLGNTLAEFSRSVPSAGSFVTFIGRTFGPIMAITTVLALGIGYILGISAVIVISGGWTATILKLYLHLVVPWQALTAVLVGISLVLVVTGAQISTKWAGISFAFEFIVLVAVAVVVIALHGSHLSLAPFEPSHLTGGVAGLSLGFPLAIYLFVGWENSASLAEEAQDPRRNVGRAIFASVALMGLLYVLLAYATVIGFGSDMKSLSEASVPFVSVAGRTFGAAVVLAYLAGFTSTFGALVAATNSQARILFSAAREGLLPSVIAKVSRTRRTPYAALALFLLLALGTTYAFGWSIDPVVFFGEIATLGTILISITYLVANVALPFYYRKNHPDRFSLWRHLVLPLAGAATIAYPLYELVKPGQPAPFSYFPAISGAIVVISFVYALVLNAKDKTLAGRVGSVVADAD